VVGLFDSDPAKTGTQIHGIVVEPLSRLAAAVEERGIDIGVLAVPADFAQEVGEIMAGAGVRSILNFAPVVVHLPEDVEVRGVDLSTELQVLGYHLHGISASA
jgi:redox-sensing transcriptional repressor